MENLIKYISEIYKDDPSAPSLTLSYLPDKKFFYGSICRYHAKFGGMKEVVHKAMSEDLNKIINHLAKCIGMIP